MALGVADRVRTIGDLIDATLALEPNQWLLKKTHHAAAVSFVLDELKKINPKSETGRRKHKNFQWFTNNVGYPILREHLGSVVATMTLSADWYDFRAKLDKLHPRYGKPTQLALEWQTITSRIRARDFNERGPPTEAASPISFFTAADVSYHPRRCTNARSRTMKLFIQPLWSGWRSDGRSN